MSDSTLAKNLEAALALADVGFPIFPARAIYNSATGRWNKPPCVSNWQSLATRDSGQIACWWEQFPHAIPAICCNDVIVIDADRHPGGPDGAAALAGLGKCYGEWPDHPVVLTPGNGEHHYFAQSNPGLGNRTGQLPPGIDVRGIGGFVIGPGAVLPDGTGWSLRPDYCPDLPQLPPWLERICRADEISPINNNETSGSITRREAHYAKAALEAGVEEVANALEGRRNTTLNNVAYRLGRMVARRWLDSNEVQDRLLFAASELTKADRLIAVMATIKSGLDAGRKKPHPDLPDRKWGN